MYYHPLMYRRSAFLRTFDPDNVVFLADATLPVRVQVSDQLYYNEFLYKITFEGSSVWHDMDFHFELSEYLDKSVMKYMYRNSWSTKCRSVYFASFEDVKAIVNKFKHGIIAVAGPVNEDHLKTLLGKTGNTLFTPDYRDKLFYATYDSKIEFSFWQSDSHKYTHNSAQERSDMFTDIRAFISANADNYRWHNPSMSWGHSVSPTWGHYNTLFLHYADAEVILPMLKLTNKKNILGAYRVFLKSDLLKDIQ